MTDFERLKAIPDSVPYPDAEGTPHLCMTYGHGFSFALEVADSVVLLFDKQKRLTAMQVRLFDEGESEFVDAGPLFHLRIWDSKMAKVPK